MISHRDNNNMDGEKNGKDKFSFLLDDLMKFLFPKHLQHPFTAERLFIFAFYGPPDEFGQMRTGFKQNRILGDYELEAMCKQLEREDIIQTYLHKKKDFGLLSSKEQEMIVAQADAHMKKAKGKAMLPPLSQSDIMDLLKGINSNSNGFMNFHELQNLVSKYRDDRVMKFKQKYPVLPHPAGHLNYRNDDESSSVKSPSFSKSKFISMHLTNGKVSEATAPKTMFMKMQGLNNADLIEKNTSLLSKHACKIYSIGAEPSNQEAISNIRLLRENEPRYIDPFITNPQTGERKIPEWNSTAALKNSAMGSLVDAPASKTTWKRAYTSY